MTSETKNLKKIRLVSMAVFLLSLLMGVILLIITFIDGSSKLKVKLMALSVVIGFISYTTTEYLAKLIKENE